jgi:ribonuclease HI
MAKYHIFTDGSSRGNPGPGGWGMIVTNEEESEILFIESDSDNPTTNNRMELKAMICAFGYAESHPSDYFIIYSDSAYVVNSCNSWIRGWAANGWKNSKKQTVENLELMQALHGYLVRPFFNAEVRKCDGHAGDTGNELADALATHNNKKFNELVDYWEIKMPEDHAGDNWFPID